MYALTHVGEYLKVSLRNAEYWLSHLPADKVPWWDFDADLTLPPPRGAQKESSAAAIAASGQLHIPRQAPTPDPDSYKHLTQPTNTRV